MYICRMGIIVLIFRLNGFTVNLEVLFFATLGIGLATELTMPFLSAGMF